MGGAYTGQIVLCYAACFAHIWSTVVVLLETVWCDGSGYKGDTSLYTQLHLVSLTYGLRASIDCVRLINEEHFVTGSQDG